MNLTPREKICIKFLSDKMEATAEMLGKQIRPNWSAPAGSGAAMLRSLRNKDLVMRLPDLKAWRLTKEGRDLAEEFKNETR